jgi:hypothetical protein
VKHDLLALTRKALQRKRNQSNLAYTP